MVKSFKSFLEEGMVDGGLAYEKKVRDAVTAAFRKFPNLTLKPDDSGGYNANVVDMYIKMPSKYINGGELAIEIKQDANAQMGGSSIKYENGDFVFAEKGRSSIDSDTQQLIIDALSSKERDIEKLLKTVQKMEPVDYHKNIKSIPFTATKTAFEKLTQLGYLRPINTVVRKDTQFIMDHYAKKGCYYIQIGGIGLFYLKSNPLNLPVPQLSGEINIEIRFARSGSTMSKTVGEKTAGAGLRVQARFKGKGKSPYTLDKIEDVITLFGTFR